MDNFWISFCGELDEGYKPDFRISKNKPDFYEGYCYTYVYNSDFVENLKLENARYREALELIIKQFPKDYEVRITEIASEALKEIESNSRAIQIGKDLSEFKIRELESKLAKAKEALQVYADDDVIGTVARKALKGE